MDKGTTLRRHFVLSPLLLLLLLLLLVQTPTTVWGKTCPPCGSTTVPFPLSTSTTCGDQSYKVRCSAATSTLFFDALNYSYPISSISPTSQTLTMSPPSLLNDDKSCVSSDLTSQGVHLNTSLPFNVSASNTIMLLNCTSVILLSPLNCSSNSLCHVYSNSTNSTSGSCRNSPYCCTFVTGGSSTSHSINISSQFCSAYRSFSRLDPTKPANTWTSKAGVELQWASPREPLCKTQNDCEDRANATCATDPTSPDGTVKRCFCVSPLIWDPISGLCARNLTDCSSNGDCGGSNHAPLIAGLVSGIGAALLVSVAGFLLFRRQRRIRQARARLAKERDDILNLNNSSGRNAKYFTNRDMKRATNNFSRDNLLGTGGYGEVYKGVLPDESLIAVKCAKVGNTKSTDQVLNEVRILSQVNHRGLVRLYGCCVDLDQPLLVYEFISNGTLSDHLHGSKSVLPWRKRLSIAHQTAEGLAYLHFSAVPPIYHRDVKSSNILLDEKLNAKVSDFGLSRLAESDLSHISTCAQGTLGYLDPEYYRNYQLTDKSDVYSFGVVLLELVTSQKAIDFSREPDDVNLAVYVRRLVDEEKLLQALDPAIKDEATQLELDSIKAIGFLAVSCLEERRQNRPSMKEVTEEIEYIMTLEAGGSVKHSI